MGGLGHLGRGGWCMAITWYAISNTEFDHGGQTPSADNQDSSPVDDDRAIIPPGHDPGLGSGRALVCSTSTLGIHHHQHTP
jgi:hypothetical protein